MPRINSKVQEAILSLEPELLARYEEHFVNELRPDGHQDLFRRFLFAYLSVQTAWETNVRLYNRLKDLHWIKNDEDYLRQLFEEERCGRHNNRARYIHDFTTKFWARPEWFYPQDGEKWQDFRKRLNKAMLGLAHTKISFVIEMVWPEADCVCLDRHMLAKLFRARRTKYGYNPSPTKYRKFESQWCRFCKQRGIKPGLARLAYWDKLQGQKDPSFWTECIATV